MPSGFGSFEEWKAALNHWCQTTYGVHPDDLPDCTYRDWYEDGVPYQNAARMAVRSQDPNEPQHYSNCNNSNK
jgi:hypothetical protein